MAERRLAVVTGAAGGIGASICDRLVADGFSVAALDLNGDGLRPLAERHGLAVSIHQLDLTDERETCAAIARIESGEGAIEALVNVLGWTAGSRFDQETSDYWHKVIAINYQSLLYVAHPTLLAMIGRRRGRMVFIASDAARAGASGQAVYAGAKAAVIAFAKSLARENARHNITVNCVAPGPTETPLFQREKSEHPELVDRIIRAIPLRRAAETAEQAAAVSFLLSADAGYLTGQTISVSGGLTMI
jgi:2-hydroxycyclohexanecarboxyl-CoA dehydrogenase